VVDVTRQSNCRFTEWLEDSDGQPDSDKPLVLVADWMRGLDESRLYNAGFAEATADALFSSLVQFDQQLSPIPIPLLNQGKLFNSPLHFIGFGQGAVVNSEIVQRLGTYYPNAGGTDPITRDLHVTTIDPYFYETNRPTGTFGNVTDPLVWNWNNVTYADNYYQTQSLENKLKGEFLDTADWNVDLNDRASFDQDAEDNSSHESALRWYLGTANVSYNEETEGSDDDEKSYRVYRRLGDLIDENNEVGIPWYTPDQILADAPHGDPEATWEGVGTGWFHSMMGGAAIANGRVLRPYSLETLPQRNLVDEVVDLILDKAAQVFVDRLPDSRLAKKEVNRLLLDAVRWGDSSAFDYYISRRRASVQEDNTFDRSMQGDFAVPTLFNGNFDAIAFNAGNTQTIPGWSLYNNFSDTLQNQLVDINTVSSLNDHLTKLGSDRSIPNYAVQLDSGESITHNRFVVPDWGALRFDLHVPSLGSGRVLVTLQAADGSTNGVSTAIELQPATGTKDEYLQDTRRIGYGTQGFETFTVDIPDNLRGKVATLKFELSGGGTVYLDNVFFKSQHLLLGNPKEARNPEVGFNPDNYLLEKPQYSLSYNERTNTANWASWQLNSTWRNTPAIRLDNFTQDTSLASYFYPVAKNDYTEDDGREVRIVDGITYIKGHLTPSADRNRNKKDNTAANLMTNIVPQQQENNNRAWKGFEGYAQQLASKGWDVYVVAGVNNIKKRADGTEVGFNARGDSSKIIKIPESLWKVVSDSSLICVFSRLMR
jgi:DNA/RNA endonuclease G (NUC1)